MFGIRPFLCGLIAGSVGGLFVSNFHVVNTKEGVVVVPRTQRPPLRSAYVDIRSWSAAMWTNHPEVTQALVADGRSSLIGDNLKDNLLEVILPEQDDQASAANSRPVGRRNDASLESIEAKSTADAKSSAAITSKVKLAPPSSTSGSSRLLDASSPVRKRWEAELEQAVAPLVEDEPEQLAADDTGGQTVEDVLPSNISSDEAIKQIESRLDGLLNPVASRESATPQGASGNSDSIEAIQASSRAKEMARDLLQEVIPTNSPSPRSAAPLRRLGIDFLNAPAPGQGASLNPDTVVPAQSQLPQYQVN